MNSLSLVNVTRFEHVNTYLGGIVGIFETVFPKRIRTYYVVGSYATDEAIEASDLDLRIIFKGAFEPGEQERAEGLREHCRAISALPLDLPFHCEADLLAGRNDPLAIKLRSIFVYGEDIRSSLPLPELSIYIRMVTAAAYRNIVVRYRGKVSIVAPLDYPDPNGVWLGYDVAESTQHFVVSIGWAATSLIAIETGHYVARKSDWLHLYREHIGDEWTSFLATVYEMCRNRWMYRLPEHDADRAQFYSLCQAALHFENHYLDVYRAYGLSMLAAEDASSICWALEAFGQIIYDDPNVRKAVEEHKHADDLAVRETAHCTLATINAALA